MPALQFQTLKYAAELVGGEEQLAARLGVTRRELDLWMSADERPPFAIFLRAADIVHDAASAQLYQHKG